MPSGSLSGSVSSPRLDVFIDMGHPLLNRTVDGFLKIGTVGLVKSAAEEAYHFSTKGSASSKSWLESMCKEGLYWGSVAGVYSGVEYGCEKIRGRSDWKNAMVAGALTGAVMGAATDGHKDKVVKDAITGGALATAAVFLNHLTWY